MLLLSKNSIARSLQEHIAGCSKAHHIDRRRRVDETLIDHHAPPRHDDYRRAVPAPLLRPPRRGEQVLWRRRLRGRDRWRRERGGGGTATGDGLPERRAGTPSSESSSSSTPSSGGGGYGLDPAGEPENGMNQKAIDDILKEHNLFRAKEHVPPLAWNETLAKFSQQYAETLKGPCKPVHSTSPYGENLMFGTGGITWKTTVDEWSDKKKSYHYGSNNCEPGKMCGHYTAVVWKSTTTVGCGRVKCNNGDTMIMCSYWPPGNYDGVKPF
ncbi:pathogenesis-related protein PRB1-3-like [Panicum miliaceum]|uniref:Pathogenesis-related protein PRB1-3-like n=1 Tax=Panicum miliaceum TaxID=4540 RepID=A0A3L6RB69_PANMI|nr:pathogenesis-related protein PRB1-3-like [Panicum miliaceum]